MQIEENEFRASPQKKEEANELQRKMKEVFTSFNKQQYPFYRCWN